MLPQVELEVFRNLFSAIAEEMGATIQRAAYSPNIKERKDFSCALFTPEGEMVAQAAHIPVHLGAMPLSVREALDRRPLEPGDVVMLNDPFAGGSHLPDITLVTPVFADGRLLAIAASRAHHNDVGGASPGSMPLASTIYEEGLRIPPVHLVRKGRRNEALFELLLANVRVPRERRGDLQAQIAAGERAARRLQEVHERYGPRTVARNMEALLDYTERMTRRMIAELPDGAYRFEDFLDDDGAGGRDLPIRAQITIEGDKAAIDFSGTAPQSAGSLNAVRAVTLSAATYVFRCLLGPGVPANGGTLRAFRLITEPGTLVDAAPPAAVSAGNVETSQRIVDVLLGALAQAVPDRIPAAGCGSMNNLVIGGWHPQRAEPFAYYETIGGGMGAHARGPGRSGAHTHMTNTQNTPVEALEHAYPLRVRQYAIRRGSGGGGRHWGGDGVIREIEALAPCQATLVTERRRRRPYGLAGGEPGAAGRNVLIRSKAAQGPAGEPEEMILPGKAEVRLEAGDRLRIETPGGGGYGRAGA